MIELQLVFLLISCHFIADYPLQTEAIALGKNRNIDPNKFGVNWQYWLTSHAFTHGALVTLVTGNVLIGIAETISHWLIDFGKCEHKYGIHIDQALHIICKIIWASFILY